MAKMPDVSKIKGKFDLQEIIKNVKSILGPAPIPEAAKDDPIGFCLTEIGRSLQQIAVLSTKQADEIAKINNLLGTLSQTLTLLKKGAHEEAVPAEKKVATSSETTASGEADK
ncbi:MAG: hypothetical protein M1561_01170 [Gammaproteobacteria bacterium]|nr:hypothetical protein [Gammaproteobacteria bacterium]